MTQDLQVEMDLRVDWLTVRFLLHGEEAEHCLSYLIGYAQDPESAGAYGISRGGSKLSNGTQVALQFFAKKSVEPLIWSDKPVASLQAKKLKAGGLMLFLNIHPPGLTGNGGRYVRKDVMEMILNRAPWEVDAARVTRMDVALDLHGVRLDDFTWEVHGKKVRRITTKGRNIKSLGAGSPKHGAVSAYDRTGKDGHDPDQPWTRIEARMKPGCAFAELPNVKNRFAGIAVTDVRAAWKALGRSPIEGKTTLSHAQLKGLKAVVDLFPKDTPKPYGKTVAMALADAVPAWWQPEAVWARFPDVLKKMFSGEDTT